jgi:hypothetical protein
MDTLRLLIIIIIKQDLKYYQIDVNNAFIKLYLKKEIYLVVPDGIKITSGKVLRLQKSLYGLK